MKQWKIEIEPRCREGNQLFITHEGKVRPCMWINEQSEEKNIFDKNPDWDLSNKSLKEIKDVHLKKFVDDIRKDPFNGLKVCFYECTNKCVS